MSDTISLFTEQPESGAEEPIFRPAIYGILIENQHVLLEQETQSGLWQPIGAVLENGQAPLQALCARFRAIVQFSPRPGPLIFMEERRRRDEEGHAWRLSHLYYLVSAPAGMAPATDAPNGDGPQKASWLSVHELSREQMQFGYVAIRTALRRLEREP